MAGTVWRMNEFWRRTGPALLPLLLCALLLHNGVVCQEDDSTAEAPVDSTAAPDAATDPVDPAQATLAPTDFAGGPADTQVTDIADATPVPDSATPVPDSATPVPDSATAVPEDATAAPATDSPDVTAAPSWSADAEAPLRTTPPPSLVTSLPVKATFAPDANGNDVVADGDSGPTAAPVTESVAAAETQAAVVAEATQPAAPEPEADPAMPLQPTVVCVAEDIKNRVAVKVELQTSSDCEGTKDKLEALLAPWCPTTPCKLEVFQEVGSNILLVASPDAGAKRLEETFNSAAVKAGLGVVKAETRAEKGSAVFVSVLILGLLLAAGLIGGFCLRSRRGHSSKAMRLAEESYPADEENQGNTLVSVAPLAPPETPEKPAVNGESPEAAKTPPPPTNGHSTTKTADTEL